jgi:hypothetical protein
MATCSMDEGSDAAASTRDALRVRRTSFAFCKAPAGTIDTGNKSLRWT